MDDSVQPSLPFDQPSQFLLSGWRYSRWGYHLHFTGINIASFMWPGFPDAYITFYSPEPHRLYIWNNQLYNCHNMVPRFWR